MNRPLITLVAVTLVFLALPHFGRSSLLADVAATAKDSSHSRLRLIIETDAGGDPDDEQSLVRLLLYANEWDVEGIIANRSRARDGENRNPERTGLGVVRRLLAAYAECYPNLVQHDSRYPKPDILLNRSVAGYEGMDDAVNLIIAAVDRPDPRPLWYSDWGSDHGSAPNNLKRALDRVLRDRGQEGYARFKGRLRLSSYDAFGDHTNKLTPPFQLLVDTFRPEQQRKRWYHRFSALTATAGGFDLNRDVLTGHGPLGALYPTNTTHVQKEGDTMTFLYLVPTGMNDPEQPTWGSWAGRYGPNPTFPDRPYYWGNQADTWQGTTHRDNTLRRWAADLQNDFRARLDWCVKPPREANHPPTAMLNGRDGKTILHLTAAPGATIELSAAGSHDPDGQALSFEWFVYPEAGTYRGTVTLADAATPRARLQIPADAAGKMIHVILAVRDQGQPALANYRRAVVSCVAERRVNRDSSRKVQGRSAGGSEEPALGGNEEISWIAPADGGTPRDSKRIERRGPHEFHIRAAFEDGGTSVLRHAISRVDVVCRNRDPQPVQVTLHLDLSGEGKRTDYDNRPESGMPLRDFLFIQPPGGAWQQMSGTAQGWIATVRFTAVPGETKVGLSPWYTYGDHLRFIGNLPAHPHLQKQLIGKSDRGREQWELTITDPSVSMEHKKKVFWHAREHAYETWSSFAVEGLVEFLLSNEAAGFRRRYLVILHPMTNVDGVAEGFEYRGGYDLPNPRDTSTARLTFSAVDRWRPDFAVTWHNWVAPRDRNVVFYTDGDNGKPTPRAWLRFTQLYPSLRGAGHRWKDETTPLKYNWEGRPLSEANVHQYAMKRYGTRVWGWEMPWWNCTVEDARRSGSAFGRAFLTTLDEIRSGSVPPVQEQPTVEVPRWEMHEFSVKARARVANPFRDAALVGEFTSPSGRTSVLDGFYDGDDTWRLRFAPDEVGQWSYLLRGEGVEVLQRGRLTCTAARGHGPIRIHPENPYAFAYADGTPFFPMGDTCYGLYDDSPITPALRAEYLKTRRAQRFNFVRMSVGHSEVRAAADLAFWAWGGTAQKPDLDRLNPRFFRGLDELLREMRSCGMNAELILLNFYRKPFTDPRRWTPARERLWLRYVIARYGAFDNIFLWTLANEYETHPDGRYCLDVPGDVDWVKATGQFIKASDPYRHPVTVHPVISATTRGVTPRDPIDGPWRIGEFYGAGDALDVLSQQTGQSGEGVTWDEKLQCWTGAEEHRSTGHDHRRTS